jgi:hypothetical protein
VDTVGLLLDAIDFHAPAGMGFEGPDPGPGSPWLPAVLGDGHPLRLGLRLPDGTVAVPRWQAEAAFAGPGPGVAARHVVEVHEPAAAVALLQPGVDLDVFVGRSDARLVGEGSAPPVGEIATGGAFADAAGVRSEFVLWRRGAVIVQVSLTGGGAHPGLLSHLAHVADERLAVALGRG